MADMLDNLSGGGAGTGGDEMMEILRIFRRDIGSQFAWSRNLNECGSLRLRRFFGASVFLLKGLKIAMQAVMREQLGSQVEYRGRRCFVSNWAGSDHPTLSDGSGYYEQHCDRSEIRNVVNAREILHRFTFALGHYMGSWYGSDVNARLYRTRG